VQTSELLKPFESKVGVISDIDDTFLVSHSGNFFKKLYILLFKNINKRKVFEDVVPHYQALSRAGQENETASNSFFYVSSSEWNLYEFIDAFARLHKLPKAVIKLKKIKTGISDFLFTGRGSHDHKFEKIKDIIMFYPNLDYVLLGDDSQKDPYLYERIVKIFPENIKAIYIRQTSRRKKQQAAAVLKNIESMNVATCYFSNSEEAIAHSERIGIL
jgi:phosphatidate phosphatase APP1